MIAIRTIFLSVFMALCAILPARAQMGAVPCIDVTCPGGLRTLTTSPGSYVFAAGYYSPLGEGGGTFTTSGNPPLLCPTITQSGASWLAGSTTINVASLAGVTSGMAVVEGQSGLPAYDVVAAVTGTSITLMSPTTAGGTNETIYFSNDNGGSIVRDNESTPVCYYRVNPQYNLKEWGGHGDGVSDDTAPTQNWFNSVQPHMGIAGTFMVTSPLTCPANTTVQGPTNLVSGSALFSIVASPQFSGLLPPSETMDKSGNPIAVQGVIGALAHCRLSGVNVVGNGYYLPTMGTISNGSNCIGTVGSTAGLEIGNYVAGSNIPPQTTVTSTTACGAGGVQVSGPPLTWA